MPSKSKKRKPNSRSLGSKTKLVRRHRESFGTDVRLRGSTAPKPKKKKVVQEAGAQGAEHEWPGFSSTGKSLGPHKEFISEHDELCEARHRYLVRSLADELRPRFESGELHGWRGEDEGRARGEVAMFLLEDEVRRRIVNTEAEADMVLRFSRSEPQVDREVLSQLSAATECVMRDVLRLVRARGWYTPTADEVPTIAELGEE